MNNYITQSHQQHQHTCNTEHTQQTHNNNEMDAPNHQAHTQRTTTLKTN